MNIQVSCLLTKSNSHRLLPLTIGTGRNFLPKWKQWSEEVYSAPIQCFSNHMLKIKMHPMTICFFPNKRSVTIFSSHSNECFGIVRSVCKQQFMQHGLYICILTPIYWYSLNNEINRFFSLFLVHFFG